MPPSGYGLLCARTCSFLLMLALIGSGATPDNLPHVYAHVDGLIVGSYFKKAGKAENLVEEARVKKFTEALRALRHASCPLR